MPFFKLSAISCYLLFLAVLTGCETVAPVKETYVYQEPPHVYAHPDPHNFALSHDAELIGDIYTLTSQKYDTLSDIARYFGLGYQDMTIANRSVDPWILEDKQKITLPLSFILPTAPKTGIVVNLAGMRLFYFPDKNANTVMTFPIGIGRQDWNTPLGITKVVEKRANPVWYVPASILKEHQAMGEPIPAVVKSGPDNPLGYYALALGFQNYLIHGTNKPYGIGMQVSHGCIQLYPEDIEALFPKVKVGTPVRIVHQPYLATWSNNQLYIEAHPPIERWEKQLPKLQKQFINKLSKLAAKHDVKLDLPQIKEILNAANGLPTVVANPDKTLADKAIPEVEHPVQLATISTTATINPQEWSVVITGLPDHVTAYKLSAMLNHQGPIIPSFVQEEKGQYKVISGPFKTKQETQKIARQIQKTFDIEAIITPPQATNTNARS